MSEIDSVKSKIRGLLSKTIDNGCSEAEALAAATKVGELMRIFNLTITDIEIKKETCIEKIFRIAGMKNRNPIAFCFVPIARFTECKVWRSYNRATESTDIHYFGFAQDTDFAIYLSQVCFAALNTETQKYKNTFEYINAPSKKSAFSSFQHGFCSSLSARLLEMAEAKDAENEVALSNSTSIVFIKNQKVEEDFKKIKVSLVSSAKFYSKIKNGFAYCAGRDSGNTINLSRPISDTTTKALP